MSRYLVGIDLGTTNIALAYVDTTEKLKAAGPKLHTFPIPQLITAGQLGEQSLLPSFLYLPGQHDLPPGSVDLPWKKDAQGVPTASVQALGSRGEAIGQFARNHGAKVPGRQVSSAKSWLCHPGVDRTAPLLPWGAQPEVPRLSPLEVSTKYLRHLIDAWNYKKPEAELEEQQVVITVPASFDDTARNLTAEAAKLAGFKHVSLLEEPQAAFYAWLGTRPPKEATKLKPGMRCLVVDVGGGTSDFSLIRAGEEGGELTFLRDAVGDHLLLGGDNMDLALAKAVETLLPSGKVEAAQFGGLVQACRNAKEAMLVPKPPESFPVTVIGRGRSVVSGTVSVPITQEIVKSALFEGFFPKVPLDAEPARSNRAGLQEMGLPYVADPAITKHLASFVKQHASNQTIDAILFNGGVFQPESLQKRILEVMTSWFGISWKPLVLTSPSLDLAVAWGAAYFAFLKHTGGKRIGGGIPRAYYIGLETNSRLTALCVVPRQLDEGQQIDLKEPELELTLGQPVMFPLFSSTVREDKAGDVLELKPDQLLQLPPLHTMLRGGKRSGTKQVPVTLSAKCTEIGTLELACVSKENNRWKLEFNVREVIDTNEETPKDEKPTILDVWPEEKLGAAVELVKATFVPGGPAGGQLPAGRLPASSQNPPAPQELTKRLEAALEGGREDWPTGLCRSLWDTFNEVAEHRTRGPAYLSRWYNLVGFILRPGFGDPLDRYRVEALWKLISATTAAQASKPGALLEGGADYWIMWRRVSGGLNTALQQNLWSKLRPVLLPSKSKPPVKPSNNELTEMWRAVSSLERLEPKIKENLGHELLDQIKRGHVPQHLFWSLTRLGTRVQLYGPLNAIVHPSIIENWLEVLIDYRPESDHDLMSWAFCLAQLARKSGLRAVDVSDEHREGISQLLRSLKVPAGWPKMVEEVVSAAGDDQTKMFGDSLPIGLKLAGR